MPRTKEQVVAEIRWAIGKLELLMKQEGMTEEQVLKGHPGLDEQLTALGREAHAMRITMKDLEAGS